MSESLARLNTLKGQITAERQARTERLYVLRERAMSFKGIVTDDSPESQQAERDAWAAYKEALNAR